jgi:hypothetical protein
MTEERKVFSVPGGEEGSSVCLTCKGETHGFPTCPRCGIPLKEIVHHEFPGREEKGSDGTSI